MAWAAGAAGGLPGGPVLSLRQERDKCEKSRSRGRVRRGERRPGRVVWGLGWLVVLCGMLDC
jgi:hypothetical protein